MAVSWDEPVVSVPTFIHPCSCLSVWVGWDCGSVPPSAALSLGAGPRDVGLGHICLPFPGGQRRDALGACLRGSLTTLPARLSGLARLAHLDLSFNSLETLPACVPQMCGLGALLLSHNHLSELPEALGALPALSFLAVTHNRLQALPTALGALSTLQCLDLSENLLDSVPPEIGGLSSLAELSLASNRLQSLPASLGEYQQHPPWLTGPAGESLSQCPASAPMWPSSSAGPTFQPLLLPGGLVCTPAPLPWPRRLPVQASRALCLAMGQQAKGLPGRPSRPGALGLAALTGPQPAPAPQRGCAPCASSSCTATSWPPCPPAWPASHCSPGWT